MGTYKDNMKEEKKPASLIPEGPRELMVLEMIEQTSKKGNRMFMTTLEDVKTRANMTIYLVAEPKKRWLLKSLLAAVGVPAGQDGVYDWSTTDVIGKTAVGMIEHREEDWINREGQNVKTKKANISEFMEVTTQHGDASKWEE